MISTLIVEDDPMVAKINADYLKRLPTFNLIGLVQNGKEAIQQVSELKPQLLLLDVFMPGMNGIELLKEMRTNRLDTDVILITAADEPHIIEEAMRLGIVDCILKPYGYERFQTSLTFYEKRNYIFDKSKKISQADLDQLYLSSNNEPMELPKGIDSVTLKLIREQLVQSDSSYTIQELSQAVKISTLTVRKYLEYLTQLDEIELDLEYSEKGRPKKLYSIKR
ncbi:response regulator [Alkalihalobacillus sp. 1P02AB]|uniref:response regulator n=1 Tax=Alkalihalobacillus sp. 1P02AB TaxID=3132260 RepID=UPI0039A44BF1